MARFGRVLRRAETGLRVTEARRSRILEEVGQDLEDAYRVYRARGLGEEVAARRAETLLGLSERTVAELGRVHASPYARLLDRFSTRGAHRLERAVLAGTAMLAVVLGGRGIVLAGGPRLDSPAVWLVLVVAAAVAGLVAADRLADLRGATAPAASSFGVLVALAASAVLVAALGAVFELWRLSVMEPGERTAVAVATVAGGAAEMLALGVIVALLALLAGFHLRSRRGAAARQRARIPGLDHPSTEED